MEVLGCEVDPVYDSIFSKPELLTELWKFLDRPVPLNDLQASYFIRLNVILLQKKTKEVFHSLFVYMLILKDTCIHQRSARCALAYSKTFELVSHVRLDHEND